MEDAGKEETRRGLYENVALGRMEIAGERDGQHAFGLTDEGIAHVDALVDEAVEQIAKCWGVPVQIAAGVIQQSLASRLEET